MYRLTGPMGLRAEKDIEKLRATPQGGWSHGSQSRKRYREAKSDSTRWLVPWVSEQKKEMDKETVQGVDQRLNI